MDFSSDGVRLHYELHGREEGAPVLLVHGFASDYRLNWVGTRWQETLTQAGYRVIGLDCRGHGLSDKPHDPASYSLGMMAADAMRLLDTLGVDKARYIGYSMGARIGLQAVLDSPERLERAVLGGLGISGALEGAQKIARALRGGKPESAIAARFQHFASARPQNDLEALAACIVGQQPGLDPDTLGRIRTPILLVVGDQDDIARDAHRLESLIPSASLVEVPGRDHMSAVPARQFKEATLKFLAS